MVVTKTRFNEVHTRVLSVVVGGVMGGVGSDG